MAADFLLDCIQIENTNAVIISHEKGATEKLFGKVKYMLDHLPERIYVERKYDRTDYISFPETNSTFYVGTAGSRAFGRGDTISRLHCSEYAFWPKPAHLFAGLREAVPDNGRIVIETTPNGVGNDFHDDWVNGKSEHSEFKNHFYPWYWHYEYKAPIEAIAPFTDDERRLIDKGVKLDQIQWRRGKLGVGPGEHPSQKVYSIFLQEYPEDDVSCFLQSGRPVFESRYCKLLSKVKEPIRGRRYILAADTAEGGETGDFSYAFVLDELTGEQVNWIHGRWSPDVFADKCYELGKKYYWATMAPERNNHGHAFLLQLKNRGYKGKIYIHSDGKKGWHTNAKTKPLMIDQFEQAVREKHILLADPDLLAEMLTFQYNDKGSAEAATGKHDDRVMAAAIAWSVRQRPKSKAYSNKPTGF